MALLAPDAFAQDAALSEGEAERAAKFWDGGSRGERPASAPPLVLAPPEDLDSIAFAADTIDYDTDTEIVTATGNVYLHRGQQELRADSVAWDRASGDITAIGNVYLVDEEGNVLYTDSVTLSEDLRAGALHSMLLVMAEGGRLAAQEGLRADGGEIVLKNGTFSPCAIETVDGCPRDPSWRVNASRVTYDPDAHVVRFSGARLVVFGAPVLPLIGLKVRTDGKPQSGLLTPNLRLSASNGAEIDAEYYWRIAENRDLQLGTTVYTDVLPLVYGRYSALTEAGAYQVTGYGTTSKRIPIGDSGFDSTAPAIAERDLRGYLSANGSFRLASNWSLSASVRLTTDRTFLRRYDISRDDRLRSTFALERIDDDSYFALSGWAIQTLRVGEDQNLVPLALPLVDYRRRITNAVLGGQITLQANSTMVARNDGQDTQRAFGSATWKLRRLTPWGQEITFTALGRADVYHSDDNAVTTVDFYRGSSGWQARGIATGAVDVMWPLAGDLFNGTQVLTPRVQLVASPQTRNLAIPNEDARAVDLEDSNLFALNRFPGYDRIEDGVRFTYGLDWRWQAPGWRVLATVGQSYRLNNQAAILPDGTGLTSRASDIVGRAEVRWRDFVKLTHRFRLDKDNVAVRRAETDVTLGSRKTYVEASYLKLNRNIPVVLEDLRDREELRLAARVAFANYWSVFGSTVINLTNAKEDPTFGSDGYDPLRTRLGVAYDDDCLEMALTWRRDSRTTGDAKRGDTFLLRFRLKNSGFQ